MGLYDRFELLELRRDDGIQTFHAREIATARPVQVHLLPHGRSPENDALLSRLDHLPDDEWRRILDRGEMDGTPYVVTDRLAGHPGFREWLTAKSDPAARISSLDQQFLSLFDTAETVEITSAPAHAEPARPAASPETRSMASAAGPAFPSSIPDEAPIFAGPAAFSPAPALTARSLATPLLTQDVAPERLEPEPHAGTEGSDTSPRQIGPRRRPAANALLGIVLGFLAAIALLVVILAAIVFRPRR